MRTLNLDVDFMADTLVRLLNIPSPTGYTDQVVHFVGETLERLGIEFTVARRGGIRATLPGHGDDAFNRAIAVHLDTLGGMVKGLKKNGRLAIVPVGTWSSRFAEGARVTIFRENAPCRGTVLPLKASGHTFGPAIDDQPVAWENLEVRVDLRCLSQCDLIDAGFNIGDFVAFDSTPEITPEGFINARHLDNKAGVAVVLALLKSLKADDVRLPVPCHILFTIAEEVGVGASAILSEDVAEMVVVDNATVAQGQNSWEFGATICMMDGAGPFDYHLTRNLISLCQRFEIEYSRDVFTHYRSDSASAIEAGHDTRTALLGIGVDGSHGYERTHMSSMEAIAHLVGVYVQSPPAIERDRKDLSSLNGFPRQPKREIIKIEI